MSIIDKLDLVVVDPNPPCVLCGEPVFGEPMGSRSDNLGFVVGDLTCCVDCYDGPPMYPDEGDCPVCV